MNTLHIIFAHCQGDVILEQHIRIGFLRYLARKVKLKDTFSKGDRRCNFMYLVLGKYHPKASNSQ